MNKPAFPRPYSETLIPENDGTYNAYTGMSLLEWYAGQALIGYLCSPTRNSEVAQDNPSVLAAWCFENAEAMIKEANKSEEQK